MSSPSESQQEGLGVSCVFMLRWNEWSASWRGQVARATFNSRGAASAWLACCDRAGRFGS